MIISFFSFHSGHAIGITNHEYCRQLNGKDTVFGLMFENELLGWIITWVMFEYINRLHLISKISGEEAIYTLKS